MVTFSVVVGLVGAVVLGGCVVLACELLGVCVVEDDRVVVEAVLPVDEVDEDVSCVVVSRDVSGVVVTTVPGVVVLGTSGVLVLTELDVVDSEVVVGGFDVVAAEVPVVVVVSDSVVVVLSLGVVPLVVTSVVVVVLPGAEVELTAVDVVTTGAVVVPPV